nr:hypothetical protein [Candidatus Njordarchaeum guaymaensis]
MRKRSRQRFSRRTRLLFKGIARERIRRLLSLADGCLYSNPELAQEYVSLAIRIGMRCKVRLPVDWKWRICKSCRTLLAPGFNCIVRIRPERQRHIAIRCLNCGRISRRNIG